MSHANRLGEHNTNLTSNKRKHRPVALTLNAVRDSKESESTVSGAAGNSWQRLLERDALGGLCEQAILSVTPDEILAQAVSPAVRCASCRVVPAAVAQAVCPRNSMQTSQRN